MKAGRTKASVVWKVASALILGAGVFFLARQGADLVPRVLEAVRGLGPWAAIAFIAFYAVATVAWVPGSVLTLASGAIFGLARGTLLTLVGATLGATLAFLVSRHLARGALERRIGADPRLAAMDEAVGREGPRLIFLLRLSPAFPFTLMNYALGLTAVEYAFLAVGLIATVAVTLFVTRIARRALRAATEPDDSMAEGEGGSPRPVPVPEPLKAGID
jgi:uncharacterized membrane protein YdjX (TVP38/TMEM64 family)